MIETPERPSLRLLTFQPKSPAPTTPTADLEARIAVKAHQLALWHFRVAEAIEYVIDVRSRKCSNHTNKGGA